MEIAAVQNVITNGKSALLNLEKKFNVFIDHVMQETLSADYETRAIYLEFLCLCFQNVELKFVHKQVSRYVSIQILSNLTPEMAQYVCSKRKTYKRMYKPALRKGTKLEREWLSLLVRNLEHEFEQSHSPKLIKLLVILESQMQYRRFVHFILLDHQICKLFSKNDWINLLEIVFSFQIEEHNDGILCGDEYDEFMEEKTQELQNYAYTVPELIDLAMVSLDRVRETEFLKSKLEIVSECVVQELAQYLMLRSLNLDETTRTKQQLVDAICDVLRKPKKLSLKQLSIFPVDKTMLIDRIQPPLTIQYLNMEDYLFRHCALYRKESMFNLQTHISTIIQKMKPIYDAEILSTVINGRCRMGISIDSCNLSFVGQESGFDSSPIKVEMEIKINLSNQSEDFVKDWDSIAKGEVLYLCKFDAESQSTVIRGCVFQSIFMFDGFPINHDRSSTKEHHIDPGLMALRTIKVSLDRHHYYADKHFDYSFNVLCRRKRRENNYWAVLDCVQSIFHDVLFPNWFHDTCLGYLQPKSSFTGTLNLSDTFCDSKHLKDILKLKAESTKSLEIDFEKNKALRAHSHELKSSIFSKSFENLRYTKTQVSAIISGTKPGLSLIVGPPGTGKTHVAIQILKNLYHSGKKTLLLAHSNQALNQLFKKLIEANLKTQHLLRLGHAEDMGYSEYGRVGYLLQQKNNNLKKVDKLAKSLGIMGEHSYTCETASNFFQSHILPIWTKRTEFPFTKYFQEEHKNIDFENNVDDAWNYLQQLFEDIEYMKPFEVLYTDRERSNLMLCRDARIIAMTTTYAALKRKELVDLNFSFETLMMEEAGTALEIETFVPLSLSDKIERIVLIGDNNQLPPVVQCQQISAESLFSRLITLGNQVIHLDMQGRTKPSICKLYSHVYPKLGNLDCVLDLGKNKGFKYDYQFIDVADYHGVGEFQPAPHYYQNLGEAEYIVAVYQYMRFQGYPSSSITILTTYNGQKALIKEVMEKRCSWNPDFLGKCLVTTVDKFQGQQSDYVLLSLVRTRNIGHFSDVRRLVVAMSRARLGLYIFGRFELFQNLKPTFDTLSQHPLQLELDDKQISGLEEMFSFVCDLSQLHEIE